MWPSSLISLHPVQQSLSTFVPESTYLTNIGINISTERSSTTSKKHTLVSQQLPPKIPSPINTITLVKLSPAEFRFYHFQLSNQDLREAYCPSPKFQHQFPDKSCTNPQSYGKNLYSTHVRQHPEWNCRSRNRPIAQLYPGISVIPQPRIHVAVEFYQYKTVIRNSIQIPQCYFRLHG